MSVWRGAVYKAGRKPEEGEAGVREDTVIMEMFIIPIPSHQIPHK